MKIIVAPDAYKGSLSQVNAALEMKEAINKVSAQSEVVMKPMADGGEGTLDALLSSTKQSKRLAIQVVGPLGEEVTASIGIINDDTAVIEIASIVGFLLAPESMRNPYKTTTYGVGEAIRICLDKHIRKFIIGLGGSTTNDGGLGMLLALGATINDCQGQSVSKFGKGLADVNEIDITTIDSRIDNCDIQVATDVDNPLFGRSGATVIFGPQKGATNRQIKLLDVALKKYSDLMESTNNLPEGLAKHPGSGAAGGLGFALLVVGGRLISGASLIGKAIRLEEEISTADLVLTGEGQADAQTLSGKAPGYVAKLAKRYDVPIVLLCGTISEDSIKHLSKHFDPIVTLAGGPVSITQAMKETPALLQKRVREIIRRMTCMVKEISTNKAPEAIGPYSQAIQAGDFIYTSGSLGVDPTTEELAVGIEKQTHLVLKNLQAILSEAGVDFSQVVKFTIYLSSIEDFNVVNDIYSSYLEKPYPARSTFEVARLPKDALIEIEAVVYTK